MVMGPSLVLTDPLPETRLPRSRSINSRRYRRDILDDLVKFHPFLGGMPRHPAELAEEIGARLTVLAVRTHVPWRGHPEPAVTLRMRHALRMLARNGGELTVTRLGECVGTGVAAASQLSTRMLRRGLVTKEALRSDGRRRRVRLTGRGWGHVPRDEPPRRHCEFIPIGRDAEFWGTGRTIQAWPERVRRVVQAESAIEEGLRCRACAPAPLLAGLRAVQATIHGFDYERWEVNFEVAVSARRRIRRDRAGEGTVIVSLGRPRYSVRPPRGRRRRGPVKPMWWWND
jgi:hypothetical protein